MDVQPKEVVGRGGRGGGTIGNKRLYFYHLDDTGGVIDALRVRRSDTGVCETRRWPAYCSSVWILARDQRDILGAGLPHAAAAERDEQPQPTCSSLARGGPAMTKILGP